MKTLGAFGLTLLLASGLAAQFRGPVTPYLTGGTGSVVFPGGTPATSPNVTRSFGSVVNPGGGGQHLVVPNGVLPSFSRPANAKARRSTASGVGVGYAYPVYIGGYDYSEGYSPAEGAPPQQPNVTIIMPPQPPTPVIINVGPGGGQQMVPLPNQQPNIYEPLAPSQPSAAEPSAPADETPHYLIAFKDHTIYSAIAYWVDGDTLHYFTAGNTHNQASVSLVDRELTNRLNKESGVEIKLPAGK